MNASCRPCTLLCVLVMSAGCAPVKEPLGSSCETLANFAITGVSIATTELRTGQPELPDFCQVTGTIDPDIGFAARLPVSSWNGKYYQSGCGGYCGSVLPDKPGFSNSINEALKLGFATITTDSGHRGALGDASWARGNPVAVRMYAGESIPLAYSAGQALTKAYYDQAPRLDYFGGCSNGGRMAAKAAQEYPDLFDGILGGGSVLNLTQNGGLHGSWVVQANTRRDGSRIIDLQNFATKLPALHQAAIAQCDASDGQTDGVISAPRSCAMDVSLLPKCNDGNETASCFTESELGVVERWYRGATDSSGRELYPGMPPGSEPYWAVWFLDNGDRVSPGNALGGDFARFLGFTTPVADNYSAMDFDFDRDPPRLRANSPLLDALDPDLREFRDDGGKFLMWHGWQDPLVLPDQSTRYYDNVVSELGTQELAVEDFFRLFMIPGHGHCWELPGTAPDRFNPLVVLDQWVESGDAPTRLVTTAYAPDAAEFAAAAICPYPMQPLFFADKAAAATADCQIASGR